MAKTRLAKWMCVEIIQHIEKGIHVAKEQKACDRAGKAALDVILKAVHKKFPPEAMKTLEKYGVLETRSMGAVVSALGQTVGFNTPHTCDATTQWRFIPAAGYTLFELPVGGPNGGVRNLSVTNSGAAKVEKWNLAKDTLEKSKEEKLADYRAVVFGSRYVEDLEVLLPLEASFYDAYRKANTSLIVSGEVAERVKKDKLVFPSTEAEAA